MGARAALLHAVKYPDFWDALILISGTSGIESDVERANRKQQDDSLADRILHNGVDAFLSYWQQTPLIRSQQNVLPEWREKMQASRSQHTAEGLAASLREFGQGSYPNLLTQLHTLYCPVLLITGKEDDKYCTRSERMVKQLPNAQWKVIPKVGHAPHLEAPDSTATLISTFRNALFGSRKS